jgi:methyl-accepting chemotaxis protein
VARDANLAGILHANLLMVQLNVNDLIVIGSDQDLREYNEYLEKMK